MTCNCKCGGEGTWAMAGFCGGCWERLTVAQRKQILTARSQGVRQEAEAIRAATALIKANSM